MFDVNFCRVHDTFLLIFPLCRVCSLLAARSLGTLSCTCHYLRSLIYSWDDVWHAHLRRFYRRRVDCGRNSPRLLVAYSARVAIGLQMPEYCLLGPLLPADTCAEFSGFATGLVSDGDSAAVARFVEWAVRDRKLPSGRRHSAALAHEHSTVTATTSTGVKNTLRLAHPDRGGRWQPMLVVDVFDFVLCVTELNDADEFLKELEELRVALPAKCFLFVVVARSEPRGEAASPVSELMRWARNFRIPLMEVWLNDGRNCRRALEYVAEAARVHSYYWTTAHAFNSQE